MFHQVLNLTISQCKFKNQTKNIRLCVYLVSHEIRSVLSEITAEERRKLTVMLNEIVSSFIVTRRLKIVAAL